MPAPAFSVLAAPAHWRWIDFIADLHLHAGAPRTVEGLRAYLETTPADAVFILGDLFEVWIGDDAVPSDPFARDCLALLAQAGQRRGLWFMPGNRDFLVGPSFLAQAQMQPLADPTVLDFGGARWLLTHGDALCTADTAYQRFRAEVRSDPWQRDFLARPLAERAAIARALREQSQARQRARASEPFIDVDDAAACHWLQAAAANVLIHGHTHRPAEHALPCPATARARAPVVAASPRTPSAPATRSAPVVPSAPPAAGPPAGPLAATRQRLVLSDWDLDAPEPRASVLRLDAAGHWQRLMPPC